LFSWFYVNEKSSRRIALPHPEAPRHPELPRIVTARELKTRLEPLRGIFVIAPLVREKVEVSRRPSRYPHRFPGRRGTERSAVDLKIRDPAHQLAAKPLSLFRRKA
jgi:hypothetical protein